MAELHPNLFNSPNPQKNFNTLNDSQSMPFFRCCFFQVKYFMMSKLTQTQVLSFSPFADKTGNKSRAYDRKNIFFFFFDNVKKRTKVCIVSEGKQCAFATNYWCCLKYSWNYDNNGCGSHLINVGFRKVFLLCVKIFQLMNGEGEDFFFWVRNGIFCCAFFAMCGNMQENWCEEYSG